MSALPLVSVVVNNHDYGRYLRAAIDSALAQTHRPLEVIVVDDGSTDDSRDVIASYGDRVRAVLKENGGQASAFNAGFAACRGEGVVFLDADDMLLPDAVARALPRLLEPGVAKVYWPLREVDAEGRELGALIPNQELPEGEFRDHVLRFGPSACVETPTSGNAWSRAYLERVLPMPEEAFRINADCYLSTLAPLYGGIRTVAEPQALYRVHGLNRYVLMTVGEKSQRHYAMYEQRCDLMARHFGTQGVAVDPAVWKEGNWHFDYLRRVWTASQEIGALVPEGAAFVLVDDGMWGDGRAGTEAIAGRATIPFLERDGLYYGRPADDASAIAELERLRDRYRPRFVVVLWLAYWWLDHYAGFAAHLAASFPCVLANDRVRVYEMTA